MYIHDPNLERLAMNLAKLNNCGSHCFYLLETKLSLKYFRIYGDQ